jgi:hypothetical protein
MKTKIMLIAMATTLAVGAAFHVGHEPPKDGKCPLKAAITAKK